MRALVESFIGFLFDCNNKKYKFYKRKKRKRVNCLEFLDLSFHLFV